MNTILLILCSIVTLEFFLLLKIMSKLKSFQNYLQDIIKILFSKETSDLKKEKMIRKYSAKLLIETFKILLLTLVIFLPFILLIIVDYFVQFRFLQILPSDQSIFIKRHKKIILFIS